MKFPQFTLRDLLWLLLVVGFALGWWLERQRDRAAWEVYKSTLEHGAQQSQETSSELANAILAAGLDVRWKDGKATIHKSPN